MRPTRAALPLVVALALGGCSRGEDTAPPREAVVVGCHAFLQLLPGIEQRRDAADRALEQARADAVAAPSARATATLVTAEAAATKAAVEYARAPLISFAGLVLAASREPAYFPLEQDFLSRGRGAGQGGLPGRPGRLPEPARQQRLTVRRRRAERGSAGRQAPDRRSTRPREGCGYGGGGRRRTRTRRRAPRRSRPAPASAVPVPASSCGGTTDPAPSDEHQRVEPRQVPALSREEHHGPACRAASLRRAVPGGAATRGR